MAPSYFQVRDYIYSSDGCDEPLDDPSTLALDVVGGFLYSNGIHPAHAVNRGYVHRSKSYLRIIAAACHLSPLMAQTVLNELEIRGEIVTEPVGSDGLAIELSLITECAAAAWITTGLPPRPPRLTRRLPLPRQHRVPRRGSWDWPGQAYRRRPRASLPA